LVGALVGGGILAGSYVAAHYFWTHQEEAKRKQSKRQVTVAQAIRVQPRSFVIKVPSQGRVRARAQSSIVPEVSGRIISIAPVFREGGFFQPGQVLLTLDKTNPSNDIALAEATLAQLGAKLALQKLDRSAYSNAVAVAQANLAQAGAALQLEEARRAAAIANLKRLNTLEKSSPLARNEPQVAEAAANTKAREVELVKSKEDLALRPDQLEADLAAQIRAAEVTLAQAKADLARTVIRAPEYPGRIIAKNADIGQFVSSGTVLALAIATDHAEVHLPVSNARLQHIRVPLHRANTNETQATRIAVPIAPPEVEIRMQLGPLTHRWRGHISRDSGRHDATSQQLALIAHIPDPYGRTPYLRAGLFVQATITGDTLEKVFVIPRHAVRHGNEVALSIQKNGQSILKRQDIEILWRDETEVVTRSLQAGDVIITTPIDYATNEQLLQVRIEGEAPPTPLNGKNKSKSKKKRQ